MSTLNKKNNLLSQGCCGGRSNPEPPPEISHRGIEQGIYLYDLDVYDHVHGRLL